MSRVSTTIPILLLLAGCDAGDREVTLRFAPRVGERAFACGEQFTVGVTAASVTPLDFRVYVHDVALVRANGERVPVAVRDDASWQHDGLVLLDFEDGSGACMTGSPGTNFAVRGSVPDHADYTGVEFTVGVPDEMNHLDGATAPAPLNAQGLWWSWAGGYKYVRLDMRPATQPEFYYHLGATSCEGTVAQGFACAFANMATVRLDGFDVDGDEIVVDAAEIVKDVDVERVPDGTTDRLPGCMAFPGDPECPAMMAPLGLGFETDEKVGEQSVFRVQAGGAS
jgi:uncharacterized repeat protein (TIGR04052 family)